MPRARTPRSAIGVVDHAGWAILVTATASGVVRDRRRVELVAPGVPVMPHHHDGQRLPVADAVALVARVRASAEACARTAVDSVARELGPITAIALRACPPLPPTVAERIADYRAMCVADWVMYREAVAEAAVARGWRVDWFDPRAARAAAAAVLDGVEDLLVAPRRTLGPPWTKDHQLAMAAAITAAARRP